MLNATVEKVTERIIARSATARTAYEATVAWARDVGPNRGHLSCGNLAHVVAACPTDDKSAIAEGSAGNIGIVTSFNDMLSAHQPFATFPDLIKDAARKAGGTAQVAGGVPAMCDGVTQGKPGMEMSLFSRDVIALAAGVALSHNAFDAAIYLGVCDKIVPGLVIAAASFGHLPAVFVPAGPMTSGLPNDEKSRVRQLHAAGEVGRAELLKAEMDSYHSPGTCTFYGTANTNQMLMEFMGLHLPGASFVNPNTPLRDALTRAATRRALEVTASGNAFTPAAEILNVRAFVNGIVGLHATGGSTNLAIHMIAMARAAGILLDWEDLSDLSDVVPLMARVYPNGVADVNHFHAAGGLSYLIGELLSAGLLQDKVRTIAGDGLSLYTQEPKLAANGELFWDEGPSESLNTDIVRPAGEPFAATGGLKRLTGNIGTAVIKVSAVDPKHHVIEAPARVFTDQQAVKAAFRKGDMEADAVVVVRFQGPRANGMPELHSLTPLLSILQNKGFRVALVTDGRMSGASGKVPAAIHLSPEAADGGPIARIREGDMIRLDARTGALEALVPADEWYARPLADADLSANQTGIGRDLFRVFRDHVGTAENGASVVV